MLNLRRGTNTNDHQFALSTSQFEVELTRIGFYDISAHLTTSSKLLISLTHAPSSVSCTFETTSKTTVTIPPIITVAKYAVTNLTFYKNGVQTTNDVLPFGVDILVNIDKKPVDGTSDGVINWEDIQDKPEVVGASAVSELSDVTINQQTLANGQALVWQTDKWVNSAVGGGGGGAVALNDLTDVTLYAPSSNQVLSFVNGIEWMNRTIMESPLIQWIFGGYYTGDVPLTISIGHFYIDLTGHTILFHTFSNGGQPKNGLLQAISTNSQIKQFFDQFRHNHYNIIAKYRTGDNYQEYIFNQYSSILEDTSFYGEAVYQFLLLPFPSHSHSLTNGDISDVTINLQTLTTGQALVWEDDKWANATVQGATGPQGPQGIQGEIGPTGPAGLTTVSSDGVTLKGDGTVGDPLRTIRSLPYAFHHSYTHDGDPLTVFQGYFNIDTTNHYIAFNKQDPWGNSHESSWTLLDYGSQIIVKFGDSKTNRYSVIALTDTRNGAVEFSYDNSLSCVEDATYGMHQLYQVLIQFNPISKIDHLADVYIDAGTLAEGQLLTHDTLLGWTNTTAPYLRLGTTNTLYQGDVVAYDGGNTEWRNSDNMAIWKDLYGLISVRTGGQANPLSLQAMDTNSKFYGYATASGGLSDAYLEFHVNHDYKVGSDMFLHLHIMTNNNSNANLTVVFTADVSLAQLSYSGSTNPSHSKFFQESGGAVTLAPLQHTFDASPIDRHIVIEQPLSTNGGSSTTLDSSKINVDSLILVRIRRNGGAGSDNANNNYTFLLQCDLHYQTSRIGTLRRTYDTNTFSFVA